MTYDWNKQVEITVPTGTNGWIYSGEVIINGVKVRFPVGVPTTVPEPAAALLNKMIELEREDENNTAKPDNHYVGSVTIPEGKTLTLAKGAKVVDEDGLLGGSSTPAPVVILPETELFPQTQGANPYLLANPLNADMEIGKTYTTTIDGTAYEVTAVDGANVEPDFAGMVVVFVEDAGVLFAQLPQDQTAEAGFYGILIVPDPSATSVTLSIVEAAKTESAGGGGRFTFNGTIAAAPKENTGNSMIFDITFDKEYSEVEKAWNDGRSVYCAIDMGLLFDGEGSGGYYYAYLPVATYNNKTNQIECGIYIGGTSLGVGISSDNTRNYFQMMLPSA